MSMDVQEVHEHLRRTRKENKHDPIKAHSIAVSYLMQKLALAEADEDKIFIYHRIADQHAFYRHNEELEKTLADIVRLFPADPISWISASHYYTYVNPDSEKALKFAEYAVEIAQRAGRFVIYASSNLCRVARQFERYVLMEKTIEFMLAFRRPKGSPDSSYECDFLSGLPSGSVRAELISELHTLCQRQQA